MSVILPVQTDLKEKVISAINELRSRHKIHPFSRQTLLLNESSSVQLKYFDNSLWITDLESFMPGGGRAAMQTILEMADKYEIPCKLIPVPFKGVRRLEPNLLEAWYIRLGFTYIRSSVMERKCK